jgi:hypothetical protein
MSGQISQHDTLVAAPAFKSGGGDRRDLRARPYGYVAAMDAAARMKQAGKSYLRSSSSAKADDPVFQRRR